MPEEAGKPAGHLVLSIDDPQLSIAVPIVDGIKSLPKDGKLQRSRTNAAMLERVEAARQVVVEWKQLCAWVPVLVMPSRSKMFSFNSRKLEDPTDRQVLFDLEGCVRPGEVMALMGPSGSGKSSLLSILGGRSTSRTSGTVHFNGRVMDKPMKRKLGYVTQDDILFSQLTVYETLYYAAMLRLPRTWSVEDKLRRVDMVLDGLGLRKCKDTIIGEPMRRGISGGERKRVSVGHELLINPSAIFLDEPTSGLDSTTALKLMYTLRSLASGGRAIIACIHQPSTRIYQQADKLMLLSEGHALYYGDASCADGWFAHQGQPLPYGASISDHMLDLASGDLPYGDGAAALAAAAAAAAHNSEEEPTTPRGGDDAARDQLIRAFESRTAGRGPDGIQTEDMDALTAAAATAGGATLDKSSLVLRDRQQAAAAAAAAKSKPLRALRSRVGASFRSLMPSRSLVYTQDESMWGAAWPEQVRHLTVRSIKTRRFEALGLQRVLQLVLTAALGGLFWWQLGRHVDTTRDVTDIGGLVFFMQIFMAFSALFNALFTFPTEFQMLVKERQSGMYKLSAYYLARTASDLPMDCLLPSLFVFILYFMAGLRLTAGAFFGYWASMLIIVLTAQSVGLLIGGTVTDAKAGQTIATIVMLCFMLVGGYFVQTIPFWIVWLKYISFLYYGFNLLLKINFSWQPISCTQAVAQYQHLDSCTVQETQVYPSADLNTSPWFEVGILLAMLVVLRIAIYFALRHRTTFKKGN